MKAKKKKPEPSEKTKKKILEAARKRTGRKLKWKYTSELAKWDAFKVATEYKTKKRLKAIFGKGKSRKKEMERLVDELINKRYLQKPLTKEEAENALRLRNALKAIEENYAAKIARSHQYLDKFLELKAIADNWSLKVPKSVQNANAVIQNTLADTAIVQQGLLERIDQVEGLLAQRN